MVTHGPFKENIHGPLYNSLFFFFPIVFFYVFIMNGKGRLSSYNCVMNYRAEQIYDN